MQKKTLLFFIARDCSFKKLEELEVGEGGEAGLPRRVHRPGVGAGHSQQ